MINLKELKRDAEGHSDYLFVRAPLIVALGIYSERKGHVIADEAIEKYREEVSE